MSSLYELSNNWQQVYDMDLDEDTWLDTLDAINEDINIKVENSGRLYRSWESDAKALKSEEERLAKKRKAIENRMKSLKGYLQDNMERMKKNKIKTDLFSFNIQNNPAGTNIVDEKLIPSKYYETETVKKFDKRAMLDDLKAGQVIAGVELKQSQSLRIR